MTSSSEEEVRVLVVEDEAVISRVCAETLSGEGFEVDVATNGSIAKNMIEEGEYNLLLVDVKTPVMNGRELYQFITEKHPELAKRVIFTTGELFSSPEKRFVEQSSRWFLPKPFTPDILRNVVKEALGRIEK